MKLLYLLGLIYLSLALAACTTTQNKPLSYKAIVDRYVKPPQDNCPIPKKKVKLYSKLKPATPYKVIGKARVSKYSENGAKRQKTTINGLMRQLAASVGGDAVIELTQDGDAVSGTIVKYRKALA